jgi:hypothetical protein
MTACPKPVRIKSKALTDSARGRACTLRIACVGNIDPGDVVFCHVRINSGTGTKPPDFWGFYGCGACHFAQESHYVDWRALMRAVLETQTIMASEGLLSVKGFKPQ